MALNTNLEGYWKLDEASGNASDSSGNGRTLTNTNTVTFGAGKINNGADSGTSNTNRKLTRTDSCGISLGASRSFSISYWFNMNSFNAGDIDPIIGMASTNECVLWCGPRDNGTFISALMIGSGVAELKIAYTFSTGTWYHIAATFNGTAWVIYVNGVQVTSGTVAATGVSTYTANTSIFNETNDAKYTNNKVDEFGLWSRILTANEVSMLYNGGNGSQYPFTDVGIAFDATSGFAGATATTVTNTSVVSLYSNRIGWAVTGCHASTASITGVTWGGQAMTQHPSGNNDNSSGSRLQLWYILNPPTGSSSVIATASASDSLQLATASFTGVGGIDATSTQSSTTTTAFSQAITTTKNLSWAILGGMAAGGAALTAGANTRILQQPEVALAGTFLISTNTGKTPAGSDTLAVTSASQIFTGLMAGMYPYVVSLSARNLITKQAPNRASRY